MNDDETAAGLPATPQYRYADVVGDRLYVAGQVPLGGDGTLVGTGDVDAQARQCLANLFSVLTVHGFAAADLHHLTVYVVGGQPNVRHAWAAVAAVFDGNVPPATLLGVQVLGYDDQLVEIDARVERG